MKSEQIEKIFKDTAYVRMGGSAEELQAARYLQNCCAELGLQAELSPFEVEMATMQQATLTVDGRSVRCEGYLCAGSGEVEAPLYYLTEGDPYSLACCRGNIVLIDGNLGRWRYQDLLDNGALAIITYTGDVNHTECAIDRRELRSFVSCGVKLPVINLHAGDAVALIREDVQTAHITLRQEEYRGTSHNVIVDLPGEVEEQIIFTAHYDTTFLSQGAYDNMSGCVGLLSLMEYFSEHPHRYSLRFIFCGSEERGLLGSKAYCEQNKDTLGQAVLLINLDMLGSIMGHFIACATAEMALVHYLSYMGNELGFQVKPYQDVYSSDSTPFADCGVPAVSFCRNAGGALAPIHTVYDTAAVLKTSQLQKDIEFITAFADRMANAAHCPVSREIPDNIKQKLDEYLLRKRAK